MYKYTVDFLLIILPVCAKIGLGMKKSYVGVT